MFTSLIDVYGHIFGGHSSEIDMRDVVLNRRIVVVLLPTLEKSSEEVANLGRIVVSMLKNMMSGVMAAPVEGSWREVVDNRATNADYPFLTIMDEVSHYLTDGMALMAGQARSLGFCLVFAAQDIAAMEEVSRKEAKAILANTNIKILMSLQDPSHPSLIGVLPGGAEMVLPALKALLPGEFVAVRRGRCLGGRILDTSENLERPRIGMARFVQWSENPDEVRRFYGRRESRAAFLEAVLHGDTGRALGLDPLPVEVVYRSGRSACVKQAIRRAFAVTRGWNFLDGLRAPAPDVPERLLSLED